MSFRMTKAVAALASTALLMGGLAACSDERESTGGSGDGILVGISMPTKSLERWNKDGSNLEARLKEAGYDVSLQYADNKVDQQITHLQNMVNADADILVVASIDGTALAPVLADAKSKDITVIAYDRLINGTEDVDYYATFDNEQVGTEQGKFIEAELGLADGEGPYNLEPFAGSPDDNNAKFFFSGAWDVLLPYVESGQLVVPSGNSPASNEQWQSIGILGWGSDDAQSEMETRLNSFYSGDEKVDVVLSPNDSLALGIAQALEAAGYEPGEDWPLITGQDGDQANVNNILNDKQAMTVWKDTRALAERVATMVQQIVDGETVEVNDEETYNNGVKVVPTYLLPPKVVVKDSVRADLVESEFYAEGDLDL